MFNLQIPYISLLLQQNEYVILTSRALVRVHVKSSAMTANNRKATALEERRFLAEKVRCQFAVSHKRRTGLSRDLSK